MKSLQKLLNPKSATPKDWYRYAQSIVHGIDFNGADDSALVLIAKIEKTLPMQQLSPAQLRYMYLAVQETVDKSEQFADAFQIAAWGNTTQTLIQEELQKRMQQTFHESVFSEEISILLETIKAIITVEKRKPEILFPDYPKYAKKFLELIQQDISQFKADPTIYHDLESLAFLKKEEEYLKGPATTEEKLLRQSDMLLQLALFKDILVDYKNHVLQTHSGYKSQKLDIVKQLEDIWQDTTLVPSIKLHAIDRIIQNPDNQVIIAQDSWGEKLLSFIHDCVGLLFTRPQTQSEVYKEELMSLKQNGTQPTENVAVSDENKHRNASNT